MSQKSKLVKTRSHDPKINFRMRLTLDNTRKLFLGRGYAFSRKNRAGKKNTEKSAKNGPFFLILAILHMVAIRNSRGVIAIFPVVPFQK